MKVLKIALALGIFLFSWLVYANDSLTVYVKQSASSFEIQLPANPTTGFQWSVKNYDQAFLKLQSQRYVGSKTLSKPRIIGAGGQAVFVFQVLKGASPSKQTNIQFQYARSWEHQPGKLTTVTVIFN